MTRSVGSVFMAAYVPAFINIHFRYARHNFKVWAALFIAPFLAIKLALMRLFEALPEQGLGVWQFDLLSIFTISILFYLSERFETVRKLYVWAVPIVIFGGLLYWFDGQGSGQAAGTLIKIVLIGYLSYRIGRFTIQKGAI